MPWPKHRSLRSIRKEGQFHVNLATAAGRVATELKSFSRKVARTRDLWIYADGVIGAKGLFLVNQPKVSHPEVVVSFDLDGKEFSIAADAFVDPAQNLAGIAEEIKSMRARERNGVMTLEEMLSAFAALPPRQTWQAILNHPKTLEEAEKTYREKAKLLHPDLGINDDQMADLNAAIQTARTMMVSALTGRI